MNKLNVLVVDDQRLVLKLFENQQKEFDAYFNLMFAENGFDALDCYARERVDLLLTDLNMPHCRGEVLIQELLKLKHPTDDYNTDIYIMTGESFDISLKEKQKLGVKSVIYKPIDAKRILGSFKKKYVK